MIDLNALRDLYTLIDRVPHQTIPTKQSDGFSYIHECTEDCVHCMLEDRVNDLIDSAFDRQ